MIGAVCDFYYPSIGGSQQLCKSVVELFHNSGKEVSVITTKDSKRKIEDFPYKIFELDSLDFSKMKNPIEENMFETIFLFADIFSLSLLTFRPKDVQNSVLVLNLDENVYRWIKEEKNGFTKENTNKIVSKIKSFSSVVSFCKGAPVNKFLEENGIEYKFIANFSRDTADFNDKNFDLRKVLGIDKDKKIIFNHGLFEERKNQKVLIEKFIKSDLKEEFCLVFLGNPRGNLDILYYKECEKIVKENGFKNSIFFLKGSSNFSMISSVLHNADIYMLPSKAEGLPLVLLEAMSANLPWISTPVGGVPEVLKDCKSGKILSQLQFTEKDLKNAILEVSKKPKNARAEWEELFTKEIAKEKYLSLLEREEEIKNKIKSKISFACPAFNEEKTIRKFLKSCLQFSDILGEVLIINHRSSDSTQEIIESFSEEYEKKHINLTVLLEERDFSKDFTLADLRDNAMKNCKNEYVFMQDADFVFGKSYRKIIYDSVYLLGFDEVYAVQHEVPVLDEGVCKSHVPIPRVLKKEKTQYRQDHVNHKHEWARPTSRESTQIATITMPQNSILSINTKTEEQKELRRTMTTYFEDVFSGKVKDSWHKSYSENKLRKEKTFFDSIHESAQGQVEYDLEEFVF